MATSAALVPASIEDDPEAHEKLHVHKIYDQIAPHFSSTRYKVRTATFSIYIPLPKGPFRAAMAYYRRFSRLVAAWFSWP